MKNLLILLSIIFLIQTTDIYGTHKDKELSSRIEKCKLNIANDSFYELWTNLEKDVVNGTPEDKASVRSLKFFRHYVLGQTDSLEILDKELKVMCKEYKLEQNYYYLWSYLINNYSVSGYFDRAVAGAHNMQEEAKNEGSGFGIAISKMSLGDVYSYMDMSYEALKYYKDALNYFLKNEDIFNMSNAICYNLIFVMDSMKDYHEMIRISNLSDSLVSVMEKRSPNSSNDSFRFVNTCGRLIAYSRLKDVEKAKKELYKCEQQHNSKIMQTDFYLESKAIYYCETGDYAKSISAYNELIDYFNKINTKKEAIRILKDRADVKVLAGDYKNATQDYKKHIDLSDSLRMDITTFHLNELAISNNLISKELEKRDLQLKVAANKRFTTIWLIVALAIIISVLTISYIKERRFNSKLKSTGHQLSVALDKAKEADLLKTTFLANMSHEIRTPLNAILGFSELLSSKEDIEGREQFVHIIKTNSDLLLKLINDLLLFSKAESNKIVISPFEINSFLNDLYISFENKIDTSKIKFIKEFPDQKYIIDWDKNRLLQLYTNFLTNAIKFTQAGKITMGLSIRKNEIKIYVSDTGKGIAKEHIAKLFDRFYKADEFTQGTGLGMSICKSITDRAGGKIGVDSVEGKGSTFWATIPCHIESDLIN